MSADFCASASVVTLSPSESRVARDAFFVDALADGEDFFDGHASDEAAGHLAAD